jgi:DNA polymerase-3 subunit epsilon
MSGDSKKFIAFDIETTGLYPRRGDRIIEIGAVSMRNGLIESEFHSLVNIPRRISKQAQQVHRIGPDDLRDAPQPEQVFTQFQKFIKGGILVAHNARFDVNFLQYELQRHRLFLNNRTICTLELSKRRWPELPNHKLQTVYRHLFKTEDANQNHRALDDARMVAEIWMAIEGR